MTLRGRRAAAARTASSRTCPSDLAPALGAARAEVFAEVAALDTGLLRPHADRGDAGADWRGCRTATTWPIALRLIAAPAVFTAAVVRAAGAARRRSRPIRALGHAADILRMLRGKPADAGRGRGAGHLSGDGQRPRPQRLDLRRPGDRLDPGGPDLGGAGRDQRAEGAAARRRAGPDHRDAGRRSARRRTRAPGSRRRSTAATG